LVYQMLHRRTSGERMSTNEGNGPPQNPMGPSPGPMGGVAQVSVNLPFHNPTPYHAFPGSQAAPTVEYCEIC
jgi:hypothetical protein